MRFPERVHDVVRQVDAQATGEEESGERVQVVEHGGGHRRPRLENGSRPCVAPQGVAGSEDPLPDVMLPLTSRGIADDLTDDGLDHAVEQIVFVRHVLVERHRHHPKLLGQASHAQGLACRSRLRTGWHRSGPDLG